ncbi:hypothetical protein HT574_05070 [Parageobacillus sp. VR-IP]|uniref:hypothetical protein n=1 Tax=Parageobacillus sp. VR-IP TaxID=2742205 RepID=UPI001583253E|nr:hypothetical protein [Parageobacillus sp. VR-IP]NUK29487.1 hypothetical protein [Parageobacillus sp. VR-IP]
MTIPSTYDFETLPEAVSFYTRKVAKICQTCDYSIHNELMRFKKELHELINREYDPAAF